MATYGSQEPLASPLDEGFNRLAWAVPYLVGIAGAGLRWACSPCDGRVIGRPRQPRAAPGGRGSVLEERLADELRDLD